MTLFPIAAAAPELRADQPIAAVPRMPDDVVVPTSTGLLVSERMVADVTYRPAPDPPRSGETAARRPRFWRAFVLHWPFHERETLLGNSRVMTSPLAQVPQGEQLPWIERTNLYRAPYSTYSQAQDSGIPGLDL